jgi:hypothetical protein
MDLVWNPDSNGGDIVTILLRQVTSRSADTKSAMEFSFHIHPILIFST